MRKLQMAAATALTIAMLLLGSASSATADNNDRGNNGNGNRSSAHACVNPATHLRGWCRNNTNNCNTGRYNRNNGTYNCNNGNGYNNGYRGLPAGSYQSSCINASIRGSVLSASCTNTSGQRVYSSLNVTRCTGSGRDIGNVNGYLRCV